MPADKRQRAIDRQLEIACGDIPGVTVREQTTAFRSILAAEAQNQNDQHKVIDVRVAIRNDQLPGIAADLGIPFDVVEDAARQAGGSISSDGIAESDSQ